MKNSSKRGPAPKKLRAIQTSQHLHVVPHRHTGHILPRSKTSYPVLVMLLLCVGVFLGGWTRFVDADNFPGPVTNSYTVNASVPGPPPTLPATIVTPHAATVFLTTPITVSGTCPQNTYVSILRNGFSSGVALCDATGNYQLSIDLFPGVNQLVAQDFSFTDVPGPVLAETGVSYSPPVPPSTGGSSGNSAPSGTATTSKTPYNPTAASSDGLPEPLLLKTNYTFLGYYVGDAASWKVSVEGGNAPYAIEADWGDGGHQLYSRAQASTLTLQHVYKRTGGFHGSYVVKITATDASGNQTYLQLVAIITNRPKTVIGGSANTTGSGSSGIFSTSGMMRLAKYIWPSYGVVVLMLTSFWLGERREFRYLKPQLKKVRHG